MPTNSQDVAKYLEFSLLQLGAESYLHDVVDFGIRNRVVTAWKYGFNDASHLFIIGRATAGSDTPTLPAYNRMVEAQANDQFDAYEIIDHHANDATGFSATLFGKRQTPDDPDSPIVSYTLSFRSTEARPWLVAGDAERDDDGANKRGVYEKGFAFAQLASMEDYWRHISNGERWVPAPDGAPGGSWVVEADDGKRGAFRKYMQDKQTEGQSSLKQFFVTGYSLSGHLATAFTLEHASEITKTYTYNGAGTGVINKPGANDTSGADIAQMLTLFSQVLMNPGSVSVAQDDAANSLFQLKRSALARQAADPNWKPFDTENGLVDRAPNSPTVRRANVYDDPRQTTSRVGPAQRADSGK